MQSPNEIDQVKIQRPVVETFVLPSGKKAQRFKFSARDAMATQREFAAGGEDSNPDDFMLLIMCKCVQVENDKGEFEDIYLDDFDNDKFDGFDYITLFGRVSSLSGKKSSELNPT